MKNNNPKYVEKIMLDISNMFDSLDSKCTVTGCKKQEVIIARLVDLLDDYYKHMESTHPNKKSNNQSTMYNSSLKMGQKMNKNISTDNTLPSNSPSMLISNEADKLEYASANIHGDGISNLSESTTYSSASLGHLKRKINASEKELYDATNDDNNMPGNVKSPKYRKLDPFKRRDRLPSSGSSSDEENKPEYVKADFWNNGILNLPSPASGIITTNHGCLKRKKETFKEELNDISRDDNDMSNDMKCPKYPKLDQFEGQCGKEVHVLSRDLEEMQLKNVENLKKRVTFNC